MTQDRNKKLAKDIVIYGIGNIGSKLLTFLLIPFLTFFIERGEMGYYDLAVTTIMLLLPVLTLQMREPLFRFLINNDDDTYRKNILSTTFFIESGIFLLILISSLIIPLFFQIRYISLIIISIYVYCFYELYLQVVRVVYSATKFMIMGLITSFLTVTLCILLLFLMDMSIEALFIGNILSRVISMIIIELPKRKFIKNLSVKHIRKANIKEIFNYSLPMLAAAIAFGVITSCGKFIVKEYLGLEDNGDFAVSEKYTTIILILGLTFYQAWQVTAVKNFREEGSSAFFSDVFNKYAILLSLIVVCISFGIRSFDFILVEEKYHQSIDLIFVYGAGVMFYCYAMFQEIVFQCTKQTSKILYSILSCAVIAPVISIFLIKEYGLMGNVAAICFSYAYLFIFRYFQTRKILHIRFGRGFIYSFLVLVGCGVLFYGVHNRFLDYSVLAISAVTLLLYFIYMRKKYLRKAVN